MIHKMGKDCTDGNYTELLKGCKEIPEDTDFEEYFNTNEYNTQMVNRATHGNCLFFSLVYLSSRLNWRSIIPKYNESIFKNLAYKL